MKSFNEFLNESKTWPLGLSKQNTYNFVMFKGSSTDERESFNSLLKNGYTFLDLNYKKITNPSMISDISFIETGRNSPRDILDDFDDFGVVAKKTAKI